MSGVMNLSTERAYGILGSEEEAIITNGSATGTVYAGRGGDVTVEDHEFTIEPKQSVTKTGPIYAIGNESIGVSVASTAPDPTTHPILD